MGDEEQARLMVKILLDHHARPDERDDAASCLGQYRYPFVAEALASVASSPEEDVVLVETAGESLGEIWVAFGRVDREALRDLTLAARIEVEMVLRSQAPELLP
jgi:hypothetical protein